MNFYYKLLLLYEIIYEKGGTSWVQWLRICLAMQEKWVDPWSGKIPLAWGNKAHTSQLLKPMCPRAHAPQQEKPL